MFLSPVEDINIPIFPNLVKLSLGIDFRGGRNLLFVLLNNMPNLEHITFLDGLVSQADSWFTWNPPVEVPACLRYKLKEITILNEEDVTQQELALIGYLLKNSEKLKTLKLPYKIWTELKTLHCGCETCCVEYI